MKKSKTIDLDGVRRGDAHLKRAKEINPNVTRRPVPVAGVVSRGRVSSGFNGRTGAPRLALTVPEVAQLVGMHPITVRREIAAGRLRAAHAGRKGHYRISRADVETWWRSRGGGVLFDDYADQNSQTNAAAGHLSDFLAQAEALARRLEAAGAATGKPFAGVDGSEMVRAGRAERESRLNDQA